MQKIKAHKQAFRRALRILYWVGLMILYLCAASRPGVWLRDAFLYRQTDGSFAGRDEYGIYALTVTAAEHETQAVFAMNGETIQYRIVTSSQENVQIYQDDRKILPGRQLASRAMRFYGRKTASWQMVSMLWSTGSTNSKTFCPLVSGFIILPSEGGWKRGGIYGSCSLWGCWRWFFFWTLNFHCYSGTSATVWQYRAANPVNGTAPCRKSAAI